MEKYLESSFINLADASSSTVEYYYYGKQLNELEKKIYAEFVKLCQAQDTFTTEWLSIASYKIAIAKISDLTSKVSGAFKNDHPEYWWYGGVSSTYYPTADNLGYIDRIQFTLKTNGYTSNYIKKNYDKVTSIAKTIADNAKKQTTVYKRIKYIHDYLATNIQYGYVKEDYDRYNIIGALINKRCVCQGYAMTFSYISRLVGIEAIVVHGIAVDENGRHAWNYVKIDNAWYLLDVTFDDPGDAKPGVPSDVYTYFLIGSGDEYYKKDYLKTEVISAGLRYPTLSATNYKRPNLM
jgi:transglutaminase-like putative cysteine protease